MAKLTIVPTPIGNLEDITLRALSTLKRVRLILAEDTRTTSILLAHFGIKCSLQSHHMHNEHKTLEVICRRIEECEDVALVSDAGTPAISDPGFLLVRECIRRGIEVECLPGPTAFVPALVASGLPCDRFVFEGFLPQKKGRQTKLRELAEEERTTILYESPFRVVKTLTQLAEYKGEDCPAAACRELSKLHEEIVRGTLKELIEHFQQTPPKGEFVLIIGKSTTFDTAK
ncbi:16S rRNA (cytidine(1402)-2'-O)-methyltransferase [Porphyromonas sp. COT-290 OH3588]|uniref:16S rRNA (cytidine(1402)-2'-O)-methyltransferase n=1 Tax=Porphyromonas sp. COT-290 OH3588 TaxID=1515617 RepID=UPI00052DDD08|nr:16S rRNA (cytidine(1402)-2'-O)-methyltransferase [Porphyromonas sp. COT-290 OH3588]KGO01166.1 16S rRNA methyltransferase [Porphyromonas sp. COT-290 OH3588]